MTRSARHYANSWKWIVSFLLIVAVWRYGMYGVDWKSKTSVVSLLIVIAILAFCVTFWKRKN
jgi:hypothetical protein